MKTAVLTTVLNEEKNIDKILAEIPNGYDIYVVDDGSSDKTVQVSKSYGAHVISLPFNVGQGAATIVGYNIILNNNYDFLVKMDGDGQHNPKEIDSLVEAIQKSDFDVVIGSRRLGSNYPTAPFFRKTFLPFFTWIINIATGYSMTDSMCGFRIFKTSSLKRVLRPIVSPL